MQIKITGLDLAHSEATAEEAARNVSKQFGVGVEIVLQHGPGGGWPRVNVYGTPAQIWRLFMDGEGWSTGDPETDAEMAYLFMKDAVEIY